MNLFWTYQWDLPENAGYPLWHWQHLVQLLAFAAAMLLLWHMALHLGEKGRRRFLRGIPLFQIGMEISKQILLAIQGNSNIGALPLHLCGLGAYVFLLAEYLPGRRMKNAFREISVVLILPGSVAALLMPDWTLYPVWNYFNLYGYLWHFLLVLYPCLLVKMKLAQPRLRHVWYEILFLAVIVPPILIFDKIFGCNYLFVNWPIANTPLSFFASFLGNPGYLIGYAALVFLMLVLVCLGFEIHRKITTPEAPVQ